MTRKLCSLIACLACAFVLTCAPLGAAYAADSGSSGSSDSSKKSPATSVDTATDNVVDPAQRADNSFIYDTSIESLFDESSLYEGRTVQVIGEVIGDIIQANDAEGNCWITLRSVDVENAASISVLMSADQAKQIDHCGKYGVTGTKLQVRGTFKQACSEHDGLSDIHATNSAVVSRGVEHPDEFRGGEYAPGLLALLVGGALFALYYYIRERAR